MPDNQWYTPNDSGAASKFGQVIGEAFADVVLGFIENYLENNYPEYRLLEPEEGQALIRLEMFGGTARQLDNVITLSDSREPVALFESKWLKDARHHNDKGAWILQLREVKKKYPTVRGAVAILAGYWTGGVGVMFESEAGIKTVLVATDEEVYNTLQPHLDAFLSEHQLPSLQLDARIIRQRLPNPWDLANFLTQMKKTGEINGIATSWLNFTREQLAEGTTILGKNKVEQAIDELLKPLPNHPKIEGFEIALRIESGNVIYAEFGDLEELLEFIQHYSQNPQAVLEKIRPKKTSKGDNKPLTLDDSAL